MGKLMLNNISYSGGGGGSDVDITPTLQSGTKIADFEIDGVSGALYAPSGGGGGGGAYSETVLWSDPNGLTFYPQSSQTITLSASIDDFDFLYLDVTKSGSPNYHNQNLIAVSSLYRDGSFNGVVCVVANANNCPSFAVVDATHLRLVGAASDNPMVAWKVGGIKVGGGGGSAKIVDTLWEGTTTAPTTGTALTLAHNVSDYDVIVITLGVSNAQYKEIAAFQTDSMVIGQDYMLTGYHYTNTVALIAFINYTSDTSITVKSSASATPTTYYKIQGIKFGGGSSETYDNTEKVVGTYFGKPLYEKSYQNIAGTGTSVNVTLSDLSNIETIFIVPEASASTDVIPFPYIHPSSVYIIGGFFTISNGVPTLAIRRGSDMASVGLKYLTVRYTKSTT